MLCKRFGILCFCIFLHSYISYHGKTLNKYIKRFLPTSATTRMPRTTLRTLQRMCMTTMERRVTARLNSLCRFSFCRPLRIWGRVARLSWVFHWSFKQRLPKITRSFTITEKAPTGAFTWLKAPTSAFTFKTFIML